MMTAPTKPAPIRREVAPPAPVLTKHGRCGDCNATAIVAGNGDLKVCPHCHALLWHKDWSGEMRQRKEAEAAARAAANEAAAQARREMREAKLAKTEQPTEKADENKDRDSGPSGECL
jgi:hypothetical protein